MTTEVQEQEDENCVYCGAVERLVREHVVLVGLEPDLACTSCHFSRGEKDLEAWLHEVKDNKRDKWAEIVDYNRGGRGEVPQLVHTVLAERHGNCIFCGSEDKIQKTSLIAASKGGAKPVAMCEVCFRSKGTKALMEWLRWTKLKRPERWGSIEKHNKGRHGKVPAKVHKVRDEPLGQTESVLGTYNTPTRKAKKLKIRKLKAALDAREARGPGECIYCGSTQKITRKHRIAPEEDVTVACSRCNLSKGERDLTYWLYWTAQNRPDHWEAMVAHNRSKRNRVAIKIHKLRNEHAGKELTGVGTGVGTMIPPKPRGSTKARPKKAKPKIIKPAKARAARAVQEPKNADVPGPGACLYCGATEKLGHNHRIGIGRRPVTACLTCGLSKGPKTLMDWLRWTREKRPERWEAMMTHNKGKQGEVPGKVQKVRDE